MQPLSYQSLKTSCWVTSMLNGILFLHKEKKEYHVPFMAYRLLHDLLVEEGVFYYSQKQLKIFESTIEAVGRCSGLEISWVQGDDVEARLQALDYQHEVAVCDIGSGGHSILINGYEKADGIFKAFDPYWENIGGWGDSPEKNKYEIYAPYMPDSNCSVNLRVWEKHLFEGEKGNGFQMGAIRRFATVITAKK